MDKVQDFISSMKETMLDTAKDLSVTFSAWKEDFLTFVGEMKSQGVIQYSTAESAFTEWANGVLDKNLIDHQNLDMSLVFFVLCVALASIVGLVIICCCFCCCCCCCGGKKGKTSKRTVTFLGLSNSGKTSLLSHLIHGCECETRMSQTENDVPFVEVTDSTSGRSVGVRIVDVPGNERVRVNWPKYASESRVVVFFINSVDFVAESRQAAEYLYDVLTLPQMQKKHTPIIIFCNKCDLGTAKQVTTIRSVLEDQLQQLVEASAIDIDTRLSPTINSNEGEGEEEARFSFDNTVCPVQFITGSARTGYFSELIDEIIRL